MTGQRVVYKQLAGQQDITFGEDQETQQRAGGQYVIDKVRLMYPVNSLDELEGLDPGLFPKAVLYAGGVVTFYQYNPSEGYYEVVSGMSASAHSTSLADGQTTVEDVNAAGDISITGNQVDGRNLILDVDYTLTDTTTIELAQSYPAGTVLQAR